MRKRLEGLLPMCACCKRGRNDRSCWQQIEVYLGQGAGATFSHVICPDRRDTIAKPQLEKWRLKGVRA